MDDAKSKATEALTDQLNRLTAAVVFVVFKLEKPVGQTQPDKEKGLRDFLDEFKRFSTSLYTTDSDHDKPKGREKR